jgi:hypothetical protein
VDTLLGSIIPFFQGDVKPVAGGRLIAD